jgi:hypothetical protein
MTGFLFGFLLPLLLLYGWGVAGAPAWIGRSGDVARDFLVVIVVVPLACAWGAAELVNLMSPRRLLDRRLSGRRLARGAAGAIAGTLSAASAAALLPLVDSYVGDPVVTGGAAAIGGAAVLLLLVRLRPGHCIHCGYDLRNGPGPGRSGAGVCPECGASAVGDAALGGRRE